MKKSVIKFFLIANLTALTLASCSKSKSEEQQAAVLKNTEEAVKPKLNDPSSYEFADLKLVDSVDYKHNIEEQRNSYKFLLGLDEDDLKRQERYKAEGSDLYNKEDFEKTEKAIANRKLLLSKLDGIEKNLGEKLKVTASYTYKYSFRGKNALGSVVLNEYIVQTTPGPDYKIVNITQNTDEMHLIPNGFPGKEELDANEIN